MGTTQKIRVDLEFNANTERAKKQMANLQQKLNSIATMTSRTSPIDAFSKDIEKASMAAAKMSANLAQSFDANTGKLNLKKFNYELQRSGIGLKEYGEMLTSMGADGRRAFQQISKQITMAEAPVFSLDGAFKKLGTTIANTIRWSIATAAIQGISSALQTAYRYAEDLNKSLTDIRVVTGYSAESMERFADKASKAAKALSTTTNEYAKASLIYFQQGLSMEEVEKRTAITVKMAQVTGDTMQEVSNQLTSIWNNFYDGSKALDYYADVITALGAATASSSEEISQGLEKFAAVAETVGLSYEYATAALATVTAETRQSADVVGTAFKTLFSRLQDLKLGKTLDDGVTLGIYSKALDAVGVNILKSNGELKDMDNILDDLGGKWERLSKAQQVALAQNVAGVRQYTQLIALMENWDIFQENIGIAQDSEGTLEKQQDIWAESWEAASQRVQGSLENIYSTLMDDDFFVDLLNFTSDFTDAIGAMVKGLGGLQVILPTIASLLLQAFSGDISDSIDRIVFSIRGLTPAGRDANAKLRNEAAQSLMKTVPAYGIEAFTGRAQVEQAKMQQIYNENAENLTKHQKQILDLCLQQNLAKVEAVEVQAEEVKKAKELLKTQREIANANLNPNDRTKFNAELQANYRKDYANAIKDDIYYKSSERMDYAFGNEGSIEERLNAIEEVKARLSDYGITAQEVSKTISVEFGDNKEIKTAMTEYASAVDEASQALTNFKNNSSEQNGKAMSNAIKNLDAAYTNLDKAIEKSGKKLDNFEGATDEAKAAIDRARKANTLFARSNATLAQRTGEASRATKNYEKQIKDLIASTQRGGQHILALTGAVSSLLFGLNSLKSAFSALSDDNMTWGEKALSIFSSLSMAIATVTKGIQTFQRVKIKDVGATLLNILSLGRYKKLLKETKKELEEKIILEEADKANGGGTTPEQVILYEAEGKALKNITQEQLKKIALDAIDQNNSDVSFDYIDEKGIAKKGWLQKDAIGQWKPYGTKKSGEIDKGQSLSFKDMRRFSVPQKTPPAPQKPPLDPKAGPLPDAAPGAGAAASAVTGTAIATAAAVVLVIAAIAAITVSMIKSYQAVEEQAKAAEEHAKTLKEEFQNTKQAFDDLMSASEGHKEGLKALKELQKGTVEYTQALNDANTEALELIEKYQDLEYHWENGAIVFENMEEVLAAESEKVAYALSRSQLANAEAIDKRSRSNVVQFARTKLNDSSAGQDANFVGIGLGNAQESNTEKVIYKVVEQYKQHGDKIFDSFENLLINTALDLNDVSIINALVENSDAIKQLTKEIAKDDTREKNAWMTAFIQSNNLGDNPNAEAIAEQAWSKKNESNEAWTEANKWAQEILGAYVNDAGLSKYQGTNNPKLIEYIAKSVYGADSNATAVKFGSGVGSGYQVGNIRIKDLGGKGVTVETKVGEEWIQQGDENEVSWDDLVKRAIEARELEILSGDIVDFQNDIEDNKKLLINALPTATSNDLDRFNSLINEYYQTGTFNLTDYTAEEIAEINPDTVKDPVLKEKLQEALDNYWIAIREANINSTEEFKEDLSDSVSNELQTILKKAEMSDQDFENYVKQFSKYGSSAEEVAKEIIKASNAQKELGQIFSDSSSEIYEGIRAINEGRTASKDFATGVTKVQNALTSWFGVELDYDYIINNMGLIEEAIYGSEEALKELRHQAAKTQIETLNIQFDSARNFLNSFIDLSNGTKHFTGEILNDYNVLNDFNKLLEQGVIEAEDLQTILANEGWQLDIEINPVTGEEQIKQIVYVGYELAENDNSKKVGERYHYISEILSDIENEYNKISKAKDRAFGQTRINKINEEIEATRELQGAQMEYLSQIKGWLEYDSEKLSAYDDVQFDSEGRVKNADELLIKYANNEDFKKLLQQYETTLNLLESEKNKYRELINQELDAKLEKVEYKIELKVSIADDSLIYLEYLGKSLKEDFEGVKKAIELVTKKLPYLQSQLNAQKEGLEGTLSASGLTYDQINRLLTANAELTAADFTDKNGNIVNLSANAIESLRKYRDGLIEYEETVRETFESISEDMISLVDKNDDKINDKINLINNLGDMAKTVRDIIDLMGVKTLGVTSQVLDAIYEVSVTAAQASAQAAKKSLDMSKQDLEEAKAARAQAQVEGASEEVLAEWDKTIEHLTKKVQDKEADMVKSLQEALQSIAEAYKKQTEDIGKAFENMMTNGLGFQTLSDMYSLRKQEDDRFLDDYQKIYELSKLNRDVVNSIDNADNVRSKQQLKELQEEINRLQESESEMTQYQVDELRARYELRLAEIALEEAQNAKSQVRMTRDSEGNYGYIYTADQDNIDKAQQNVEDKLYALQELQQEYQKEMQDRMMELPQQYRDMMLQIATDETLTEEERKKRMEETTKFYQEQYEYLAQQLGLAIDHSNDLYNNDWANYSSVTGYKMSEQDKWIDAFDETIVSQITGYGNLEDAVNNFGSASQNMVLNLNSALTQYKENTDNVFDAVGITVEEFSRMIATSTAAAKKAIVGEDGNGGLAQDIKNLATEGETGFKSLVDSAHEFYLKYDNEIKSFISSNDDLIESIGKVIAKYAELAAEEQDIDIPSTKPPQTPEPPETPETSKEIIVNLADNYSLVGMKDTKFAEGTDIGFKEQKGTGKYLVYDKTTGEELGWTDNPRFYTSNGANNTWMGLESYDSSEYDAAKAEEEEAKRKKWEEETKNNPTYVEQEIRDQTGRIKYYKMAGINWLVKTEDLESLNSYYTGYGTLYNQAEVRNLPKDAELSLDWRNKSTYTVYEVAKGGTPYSLDLNDFNNYSIANEIVGYGRIPLKIERDDGRGVPLTYYINYEEIVPYDTGGYTGSWDSSGRLAMLHQKEIVLNARDTENFLAAIDIVRDIVSAIDLRAAAQQSALSQMVVSSIAPVAQTLQQEVTIHAEFPNATQRTEIEAAFDTLLNRASQFANRKK